MYGICKSTGVLLKNKQDALYRNSDHANAEGKIKLHACPSGLRGVT